MYRGVPDGSGSKRWAQLIALALIVIVALVVTVLVTWLVVVSGLEFWAFAVILGTIIAAAFVILD